MKSKWKLNVPDDFQQIVTKFILLIFSNECKIFSVNEKFFLFCLRLKQKIQQRNKK
jgi:hypothetical protein